MPKIIDLNAVNCLDVSTLLNVGDSIKYSHVFSEDVYLSGIITDIKSNGQAVKIVKPDSDTKWIVPLWIQAKGIAKTCLASLEILDK
jgi:hypothetical protein